MELSNLRPTFGAYLDFFDDVDLEAFLIMKPHHIEKAIPSFGTRIKFEKLYAEFLSGLTEIVIVDKTNEVNTSSAQEVDASIQDTGSDLDDDMDEITAEMLKSLNKEIPKNNEVMFSDAPKEKTYLRSGKDILNIPSIDLKIVIEQCMKKKIPLENSDRTVIAKEIIHYLLVNDFERKIEKTEFIRLTNFILEIFPTEETTAYYIPSYKNNNAQGKLYSAYSNYKATFRSANLCCKRQYIPKRNNEGICDPEKILEEPNQSDEIALKNTFEISENLELIRKFWESSYYDRKKLLLELNTNEYLKKFPAFDLYNGYELFILDADKIIGHRRSKLPEIAKKVFIFASRQKRPSPEVKKLLKEFEQFSQHLDENAVIEFEQLTALKLLPQVMSNPSRKFSKSEASSYFVPYYKTALEADVFKNTYFKPDELFPRLLLVGEITKPSTNLYVSDKQYAIENPISGFEVLFRAFLSLNCKFPVQSQHVWEFVQKIIYDFPSDSKKRIASVETFMQDIRNISIN